MKNFVELPNDEERHLLRDSVRGLLMQRWPVEHVPDLVVKPDAVREIWRSLCSLGVATLGTDPEVGGLRELTVVLEELGRAACPAPVLEAGLTNLALLPLREESPPVASLLAGLHEGGNAASLAFGVFDGDCGAGMIQFSNGKVTGQTNFVEGAGIATHMLAFVEQGPGVAIIEVEGGGVRITPTPGFAVPPVSEVTFSNAPATLVKLPRPTIEDINLLARLGMTARAIGSANRSFEMVVEYSKTRKQFGTLIGKFQAIQHKLTNCLMSLDGARLLVENAASSYDHGSDDWRVFASAACAFASPALRQVSLETQHVFGAIGFAEEHEAPRHFRRVHADVVRFGGPARSREELAQHLLGPAV